MIVSEEIFKAINLVMQEKSEHLMYDHHDHLQLYLIADHSAGLADQIRTICENHTDGRIFIYDVEAEQQDMNRTKQ